MAKADRLKEEIGWLKLIFGVLAAVDASLVAWLAQNYTTGAHGAEPLHPVLQIGTVDMQGGRD